jgi:hypothetical protein
VGYCNDNVTTLDQLRQIIHRTDGCKIIYIGNQNETFSRIQQAAALENRCSAWLRQRRLLQELTPPLNAPSDAEAGVICKSGALKEWLKSNELADKTDIGMAYDECISNC